MASTWELVAKSTTKARLDSPAAHIDFSGTTALSIEQPHLRNWLSVSGFHFHLLRGPNEVEYIRTLLYMFLDETCIDNKRVFCNLTEQSGWKHYFTRRVQ